MHNKKGKRTDGRETETQALLIFKTLSGVCGHNSVWETKQEPWPRLTWGGSSNLAQERLLLLNQFKPLPSRSPDISRASRPYNISQAKMTSKEILRPWPLGGERPWYLHSKTLTLSDLNVAPFAISSINVRPGPFSSLCLRDPLDLSHLGCV